MMRCRKVQGLIAASLYEEAAPDEQAALRAHLERCSACRAQAEALQHFVDAVPAANPSYDWDMLPAIRRRLEQPAPASPRRTWRWVTAASFCATVMLATLTYHALPNNTTTLPAAATATITAQNTATEQTLDATLTEVERLESQHDYIRAVELLTDAVESCPEDPAAGRAQAMLAGIEYSDLQWYGKAHEEYRALAERYPALFMAMPEAIERHELLAETAEQDYAPLYRIDAAVADRQSAMPRLEDVIAQYPGPFTASLAAQQMARQILEEGAPADVKNPSLYALEEARARCTHPVAVAQLTLEMGSLCLDELRDPSQARYFFAEVAASPQTMLAQRECAKDSLLQLMGP